MKNYFKNIILYLGLVIVVISCSYLWKYINIPLNNPNQTVGYLTLKNYNPINDTIRYVFFIITPLIYYLLVSIYFFKKEEIIDFKSLLKVEYHQNNDFYFKDVKIIFFLLICLILCDFFSTNIVINPTDIFHVGDYMTPAINYYFNKNFWISTFSVHGGADFFYPIFAWKLFGFQTIGSVEFFNLIIIFFVKIFSLIFVFYLVQFFNFKKNYKIFFFTVLSIILLSLSKFNDQVNYLTNRDIFLLIFLIFFIQCFYKKNKIKLNISLTFVAFLAVIFNIDIGLYLLCVLFFYNIYLLLSKQFKDFFQIIFSGLTFIVLFILVFGVQEFESFMFHTTNIIKNIDLVHGLEYPQPFFSMEILQHGSRATKSLIFQLLSGLFILSSVIYKNNKYSNNQKVFLIFFYLLCFISFKNALGRSDGYHIKLCSDMHTIIISFYILIFVDNTLKKFNSFYLTNYFINSTSIFLILLIFFNLINFNNILNFKSNTQNLISANDNKFLKQDYKKKIDVIRDIFKNEVCFQNFTEDLIIPYLVKKPSCTKYFSSWLASGRELEMDYIQTLKEKKPNFILYTSPSFSVDSIKTSIRLKYVNSYILKNYKKYYFEDGFSIYQISN